jgi:RNA polymerase sigma factor (sigma-70 family)
MTKRLTEAQRATVAGNVKLAYHVANRLRRLDVLKFCDPDDAAQEAVVACCNAVRGYDPARGATLPTFIVRCVWRWLVSRRKYYDLAGPLRRVHPGEGWENNVAGRSDPAALEDRDQVEHLLAVPGLTGREREALTLYAEGLRDKAVAARLNVSRQRAALILSHALTKVRQHLSPEKESA